MIGIDKNIPGVPSTDILAHIENNIQNGCIPNLSPISFGVIKLESINGTIIYNPIVMQYWYRNAKEELLGIWNVGGNNFNRAVEEIFSLEILEHSIERIVIITDNDDCFNKSAIARLE